MNTRIKLKNNINTQNINNLIFFIFFLKNSFMKEFLNFKYNILIKNFLNFNFKFLFFKSNFNKKFIYKKKNLLVTNESIFKNISIRDENKFNNISILNLFFITNYSSIYESLINHNFSLMFLSKIKKSYHLNPDIFLKKWNDGFLFLSNIFYFELKFLIFSIIEFKNQVEALNWKNFNNHEMNLWRYLFPIFTFKNNKFNDRIDFFYKKFLKEDINFFFITDVYYHFKNIYYFNKNNIFTIGLATLSFNPWLLSYSFPTINSGLLIQSLFFNFLILSKRNALKTKYLEYNKMWNII